MLRRLSMLADDGRGSILPIVAVIAVVGMGMGALSLDTAKLYVTGTRLQLAADSAALAALVELPDATRARAAAQEYAAANMPTDAHGAVLKASDVAFGRWDVAAKRFDAGATPYDAVRVTTRRSAANDNAAPTSFAGFFGIEAVDLARTAIAVGSASGLELAMVLDVTGSMSGTKMTALKQAATALLDKIYQGDDTVENLRVAVVPFTDRINIGTAHADWLDTSPPTSWDGCVEKRLGTLGLNDSPPSGGRFERSSKTTPCPPPSLPLTASRAAVQAMIDGLPTAGDTRTDMGLAWGWRTLSPQWQGVWQFGAAWPQDASNRLVKAVVIMTDGINDPPDGYASEAQADSWFSQTCQMVKDAGIRVYTVTFSAPASIDPLYEACASKPAWFFRSPSAADLQAAFDDIGRSLVKAHLVH